ncbi:MAG: hypothetical protein EBW47_10245, partial [Betaproteobacteria bacterium]|nr:hypothetical protein [Betaproteobacteria bacterium]
SAPRQIMLKPKSWIANGRWMARNIVVKKQIIVKLPVQWFFKWLPDNAGMIVFSRERLMTSRA